MEENEEKVSNIKWIIFLILLIGVLVYTIVVKLTYKPDLTNVYVEEANTILFLANTIDKFNKSGIIEESKPNNINISVLRKDKEYKKTLLPYIIGACILFGASTIAGIIYNIAINL